MNARLTSFDASYDRRRETRVPVAVKGRVMLDTKQELDCQITDISLSGMHLRAQADVSRGSTIVAYVDHFGRLQGQIVRKTSIGFAVTLNVPGQKRERLGRTLDWLAKRGPREVISDRLHERIVPKTAATSASFGVEESQAVNIIDFSRSGAAVEIACGTALPYIGTRAVIGRTAGRVVRHFANGVGIEFFRLVPVDLFDEDYNL